ncbi:SH3 domain-containing protein [Streptomyces regalis]|uniref:SH3 domain-containing protein n=1 Tax=Streptomyces regalis TaxID=68262 RepID=UPI000AF96C51|nr:SH3 domain-containing protein [Streptomyces regalis]
MKLRQNVARSLAVTALGLSVLGAGITTAPAASAAPLPKGCIPTSHIPSKTTEAVNLRTGPGKKYKSLGILSKGTRFNDSCMTKDFVWFYGKVGSGPNKGKKGWVNGHYLKETGW